MAKAKLNANDKEKLFDALKALRNALEEVGIDGHSTVTFWSNGNIIGVFEVEKGAEATIQLLDDDDEERVRYEYARDDA